MILPIPDVSVSLVLVGTDWIFIFMHLYQVCQLQVCSGRGFCIKRVCYHFADCSSCPSCNFCSLQMVQVNAWTLFMFSINACFSLLLMLSFLYLFVLFANAWMNSTNLHLCIIGGTVWCKIKRKIKGTFSCLSSTQELDRLCPLFSDPDLIWWVWVHNMHGSHSLSAG